MDWKLIIRLMHCFPRSFINQNGEFIAHLKSNTYFRLEDCNTEMDVKSKVLERLSRATYKTEPYRRRDKNDEFHSFMLKGINEFWGRNSQPRKWNRFTLIWGMLATMRRRYGLWRVGMIWGYWRKRGRYNGAV